MSNQNLKASRTIYRHAMKPSGGHKWKCPFKVYKRHEIETSNVQVLIWHVLDDVEPTFDLVSGS